MKMFTVRTSLFLAAATVVCACETAMPHGGALATYQESMRAYRSGDLAGAESGLTALTRRFPGEADAWFRLGNVRAKDNRLDDAIAAYREALVRDPRFAKAWHNLAVVQLRQASESFIALSERGRLGDPLQARGARIADDLVEILGSSRREENVASTDATNEPQALPEATAEVADTADSGATEKAPTEADIEVGKEAELAVAKEEQAAAQEREELAAAEEQDSSTLPAVSEPPPGTTE